MTALDQDQVIAEVARRHKILLTRDDPILAVLALHEVIFAGYIAQVNAAVDKLQEDMEGIAQRYTEDSKTVAKTIIGQAVDQTVAQIRAGTEPVAIQIRANMEDALDRYESIAYRTMRAEMVSVISAVVSVVALGIVVALL
jgi:hypothetical protein